MTSSTLHPWPDGTARRDAGAAIDVDHAARTTHRLLRELPERLAHSAEAARRAEVIAGSLVGLVDADLLVAAAWLHDIGYAEPCRATGFHPLDGALHLAREGWDEDVVRLVAHHSHADLLAPYHGLTAHLAVISERPGLEADALTLADLTAGVDGRGTSVEERLAEMRIRHEHDVLVPQRVRERRYAALLDTGSRLRSAVASVDPVRC